MSSMKNFKMQRTNSKKQNLDNSRVSMMSVSQSQANVDLQNLAMNFDRQILFKLHEKNGKILGAPSQLHITNNTGAIVFVYVQASSEGSFEIHPKKYILARQQDYIVQIKFAELPYAQFQDFQAQNFRVSWGRMQESENKSVPNLTNSKILGCKIVNREQADQMIIKAAYQSQKMLVPLNSKENRVNQKNEYQQQLPNYHNYLNQSRPKAAQTLDILQQSNDNYRDQHIRSKMIENSVFMNEPRPSLLRLNVIVIVALFSFVVGFASV